MTKILAVDDEDSIRELLAVQLKKNGYEPLLAEDGEAAIAAARREKPDLILLDLMLPKIDGFGVCRELKSDSLTAGIPIIMLTARAEEIDRVLGLELGADDYIVKPFSMREVLARIKAVLRRTQGPAKGEGAEERLRLGQLTLDLAGYTASLGGEPLALTPKEYELLKLLVTNIGRAFTRDDLLTQVWGYEYYGDTRTVDVHIQHLRAKLSAAPEIAHAIETVRGVGYRMARPGTV